MLTKFETKTGRVKGLAFHPKRPWVLTSLHNGSVQIWDYRMGTIVDTYTEHEGPVRGCAFHPTQPLFATCGDDNKVRVFNFQQKKCLFTLSGHQDYIRSVAFHHESPWLMTASDDQTIRIWNWQSRACIAQLTGHSHYVMCAQFHPTDDLVVSASLDQTIRVWDIGHLKRRGSMTPMDEGGRAGQIDLFATSDGQVKFVLEGHDRGVNWVQFHPTKPMIVSGSDDRTVKLWRYNDSRAWETDTFRGHINNVSCVSFHPTAELILSASEDKTLRVWDYAKRGSQAQVFRREADRYWMLAVHPVLGIFVAGHDAGFCVFKLERERPPSILIEESLFYLRGATMLRRDLNKPSGSETTLVTLGQAPTLPALLDYSAGDKAFLISSGNEHELVSRTARKGPGGQAMFIGGSRYIVHDTADALLYIKQVADGATVGAITSPIDGLTAIFHAPDNCILLAAPGKVALLDLDSQSVIAELPLSGQMRIKRVSWSPDGQRVAFLSRKGILLTDKCLVPIAAPSAEPVTVKSAVWSRMEGAYILFYTTPHHFKYMLPSGETGLVCTTESPLYLVRTTPNGVAQALDRAVDLVSLRFDPAECAFKLALLAKDLTRALLVIRESTSLVGQSVVSYLRQQGYAQVALQFVDDPLSRLELAMECAEWPVALEAASLIASPDAWLQLAEKARFLGFPDVASTALSRAQEQQQQQDSTDATAEGANLLLHCVAGKIKAFVPTSPSVGLQAAILSGSPLDLAKQLESLGLPSLAHLAYQRAGQNSSLTPPSGKAEAYPVQKLAAPMASNPSLDPWPMTKALADLDLPSPPPLQAPPTASAQIASLSPMADAGDWDEGDLGHVGLGGMGVGEAEGGGFTDFSAGPVNPLLASRVPVLHLLAGNVDSAKRLLQAQAGIVDWDALTPVLAQLQQRVALSGSLICRFEDIAPLITLGDLTQRFDEGLQLTTEGKFTEAITAFEWALQALPFALLEPHQGVDGLVAESREYLLGLRMELKRKELLATAGEHMDTATVTRVLELAAYFTCCKLRPAHLALALRSAMTLAFKLKQVGLSGNFARRLLDLQPAENIAAQAQKVLSVASTTSSSNTLDIQYDDHLDFDLDASRYTPIHLGQQAISCPHCGALYGNPAVDKASVCRICRIASVGASATGLQLHL